MRAACPGTRLGHYDIRSLLGAGGVAEVYRRDTRLDRALIEYIATAALMK